MEEKIEYADMDNEQRLKTTSEERTYFQFGIGSDIVKYCSFIWFDFSTAENLRRLIFNLDERQGLKAKSTDCDSVMLNFKEAKALRNLLNEYISEEEQS